MKRWILGASGVMKERDPTLERSAGEVRETEESRGYLKQERRLIEQRKTAAGSNETHLVGLALSGGGIRSAAFSFGVIQALAERDVMKHIDYLSTVSGGGYTGSAYSAWCSRRAAQTSAPSNADTAPQRRINAPPPARWQDLLPHLRNFSNYISPLASSGVWRIISTMVRNLTIHWLALVAAIVVAFALLLLTLRFLWAMSLVFAAVALVFIVRGLAREYRARRYFAQCHGEPQSATPACESLLLNVRRLLQQPRLFTLMGLGFYALAAALWFVTTTQPVFPKNLGSRSYYTAVPVSYTSPANHAATNESQTPAVGSARYTETSAPQTPPADTPPADRTAASGPQTAVGSGLMVGVVIILISAALTIGIGFASEWRWRPRRNFWPTPSWLGLLFVLALVLGTWFGLAARNGFFEPLYASQIITLPELFTRTTVWSVATAWTYVWQTALVLGLFALLASIIIAVLNRQMDREEREWTTRVVAVSLTVAFAFLAFAGLALVSCRLAEIVAFGEGLSLSSIVSGFGLSGAWLAISGAAAWLAKTESVQSVLSRYWKRVLVAIGPTVFAVGLVLLVCFGAALALMKIGQLIPELAEVPPAFRGTVILWSGWYAFALLVVSSAVFAIAGIILDPNEFSLHGFYRDRLVRCFLGASNADNPAPDAIWNIRTDDIPLATTAAAVQQQGAPLQLINTAVNLFNSKDLRVLRRRSDSFVLTPLCCGSHTTGYAPTPPGLYLGTAMAISGAAVSPNMGVYTRDPALAALMTFFNLRLGYWFGNPRKDVPARRKRPLFAPTYLIAEAFALTNEDRSFVHLSDGGHYDNLGLYELLRRRCRYIIAVDAECDPAYRCTALAWLVRMARIDLGVEIDIKIERIADHTTQPPRAQVHWLLGEITYPRIPGVAEEERGQLLYIKSSLLPNGKNSHVGADVLEYASSNPTFPHETTADQFFSESQFESYRMLGESITKHMLDAAHAPDRGPPLTGVTALFERLDALKVSGMSEPREALAPNARAS